MGLGLLTRCPVSRVAAVAPHGLMFFIAEQMRKLVVQGAFYRGFSQIIEQVLIISGSFSVGQELINDLRIKLSCLSV